MLICGDSQRRNSTTTHKNKRLRIQALNTPIRRMSELMTGGSFLYENPFQEIPRGIAGKSEIIC